MLTQMMSSRFDHSFGKNLLKDSMELYDSDDSDSFVFSRQMLEDMDNIHPAVILRALMSSMMESTPLSTFRPRKFAILKSFSLMISSRTNKLCKFFVMGRCSKGTFCSFSHNTLDSDHSTQSTPANVNNNNSSTKGVPCKFFAQGQCFKGKECNFLHNDPNKTENKDHTCAICLENVLENNRK